MIPTTGFEPKSSGVGTNRSIKCAKTTVIENTLSKMWNNPYFIHSVKVTLACLSSTQIAFVLQRYQYLPYLVS